MLVIGTDMDQIFVLGSLWNGKDKPPPAPGAPDASGGEVQVTSRIIRSRSGHLIELRDEEGSERILIRDKNEKNFIVFDTAAKSITIESAGDLTLKAGGKVSIISEQAMSFESEQDIKIAAKMEAAISGQSGANIETSGSLTIKGTEVTVEGTATATLKGATVAVKGSALTEIKGAIVKIN